MSNPNKIPLAQSHSVALQVPNAERYFFHDPGLTRLDDGSLILAAPQWQFMRFGGHQSTRVARSTGRRPDVGRAGRASHTPTRPRS